MKHDTTVNNPSETMMELANRCWRMQVSFQLRHIYPKEARYDPQFRRKSTNLLEMHGGIGGVLQAVKRKLVRATI
jgi:hypothetical protein